MKRFKPPKNRQYSKQEVRDIANKVGNDASHASIAIMFLAMNDELKLSEDDAVKVMQRVERYSGYLDDKVLEAEELFSILEKNTGLKFNV